MSALTLQNGALVLRNGTLGTGQGCCCGGDCRGPCGYRVEDQLVTFTDCRDGCRCTPTPCGCVQADPDGNLLSWYHCTANCGQYPDQELVAFAVCLTAPTEQAGQLRGPLEGWVGAVRAWMQSHGYTNTSFDSERCTPQEEAGGGEGGSQNVMITAYGCCAEGFDLDGECLNVGDLEPNIDRPYTATVFHNTNSDLGTTWAIDIDCDPPTGIIGRVIPPCNPLP